ncbi:MAG: hypothetical protein RR671_01560, partial [Raoultibacter sp.]
MFKAKAERQIAQAADKIVSQKERIDAMSWGRVTEIAYILQNGCDEATTMRLGFELSGIANSNISLYVKLGIIEGVHTGQMMPSGIEVLGDSHLGKESKPAVSSSENVSGSLMEQVETDEEKFERLKQGDMKFEDEFSVLAEEPRKMYIPQEPFAAIKSTPEPEPEPEDGDNPRSEDLR